MRSRRLLEIRRDVIKTLERLAREINATVYLFGSYARGDHMVESDIDILVVCECFEGMWYIDRVIFIRQRLPKDLGFDIVALTPREFEKKMNRVFFKNISRYWIEIKP